MVSGKKNPVSGNSGSLAQEIASGYKPTMEKLGLLRTPSASEPGISADRLVTKDGEPAKVGERAYDKFTGRLAQVGLSQQVQMRLIPTPTASDATMGAIIGKNDTFITTKNGTPRKVNQNGENGSVGLGRFAALKMLPTPTAYDNPAKNTGKRNQDGLQKRARQQSSESSQLNPLFVEEMMGFPFGYTISPFLSEGIEQPSVDLPKDNWHHFPQNHPTIAKDSPITNLLNNVSLSKWRNESIKGYGNAVVPQIPLKIFQAIEQYNKTTNSIKKD